MSTNNRNIIETFLKAASESADAVALLQDGQAVTYGQLYREVVETAALFQSKGFRQGDMVLVFVPMSLPLYRIVLALLYMGARPVFLDEWVSISRLKACLEVVPCKGIIAAPKFLFLSLFISSLRRIPIRIPASAKMRSNGDLHLGPAEVLESDTALVTFTTGSAGIPKAANRTHAYLYAQLAALNPLLKDVHSPCMTLLPIVVLLHLASGKSAVLPPKRFKASKAHTIASLLTAISVAQPKAFIASPAIVEMLVLRAGASAEGTGPFSNIKTVITGGGPVYPSLAKLMIHAFPSASITAVYGSTEAEPISHIDASLLANTPLDVMITKGLPVGLPDVAAEVAILEMDYLQGGIVDTTTFLSSLQPANRPGEVIVAGDHVLRHYINNPQAEAETKLIIGEKVWHRTGDCGILDNDGNLYLLGRCNEAFTWKGREYYPAIISYALRVLAGTHAATLILQGNTPTLVLAESEKPLIEEVERALDQLHLVGAQLYFIKEIPKDPRHQTKVDYIKLRSMLKDAL